MEASHVLDVFVVGFFFFFFGPLKKFKTGETSATPFRDHSQMTILLGHQQLGGSSNLMQMYLYGSFEGFPPKNSAACLGWLPILNEK